MTELSMIMSNISGPTSSGKREVICDITVSYTHLDVYKRQVGNSII